MSYGVVFPLATFQLSNLTTFQQNPINSIQLIQLNQLLSATGITNFSPDHISSTAQTLISTSPFCKAKLRMISSVMSVTTFDAFFGQDIQIIPLGLIWLFKSGSILVYSSFCLVKKWTKSFGPEEPMFIFRSAGKSVNRLK